MEDKLSQRLTIEFHQAGLNLSGLAKELRISRSHLSELLAGKRSFGDMHHGRLRRIAAFLNLSAIEVFFLSGKISINDFYRPGGKMVHPRELRHLANATSELRQHRL